ncbi:MAG: patatin-like phospholipase family protein [Pseudomonadota bacterium]
MSEATSSTGNGMEHGKIGLALGGGGARGWAHIGVLRRLNEAGIFPDVVVGTSIGAVVGGAYAANKLDPMETFTRGLTRSKMFGLMDFSLAGSGLITGHALRKNLNDLIGHDVIEDLPLRFVAVATELHTGHEVWLSRGRLMEAISASYALPGIFRPVRINKRWLIDGAVVNPIPVSVCRALGAEVVIAVNLNATPWNRGSVVPNFGTGEDDQTIMEADAQEREKAPQLGWSNAHLMLHRQFFGTREQGDAAGTAPGMSAVMMDAFSIIQDRVARARMVGDPPDVMIKPKLEPYGLFDFHKADELIALGQVAADREMHVIEDALQDTATR